MSNEDYQSYLDKKLRDGQEKYSYYLVALSVSCIGFSVFRTLDKPLEIHHILIALSVLMWGITIVLGLRYNLLTLNAIRQNYHYYEVIKGNNEVTGTDPKLIEFGKEVIKKMIVETSDKAGKVFKYISYCFFSGVVFFVAWHIICMHYNK